MVFSPLKIKFIPSSRRVFFSLLHRQALACQFKPCNRGKWRHRYPLVSLWNYATWVPDAVYEFFARYVSQWNTRVHMIRWLICTLLRSLCTSPRKLWWYLCTIKTRVWNIPQGLLIGVVQLPGANPKRAVEAHRLLPIWHRGLTYRERTRGQDSVWTRGDGAATCCR